MLNYRKFVISGLLAVSGSNILKNLKEIQSFEKLSKKELEDIQNNKLKKLLVHSYKNVPYYFNILNHLNIYYIS